MVGVRPGWALKAIVVVIITSILFRCICASKHSVGGPSGWDLRSNLSLWSAATTFLVGDDLVFTYTPIHDVVEVNQLGYNMCRISNAIGAYDDGETVIHLTESGTRYFICGRPGQCQRGLKLQVQVHAQSNNGTDDDANNRGTGEQRRRSPRTPPPPRRPPPPPPPPSTPNTPSAPSPPSLLLPPPPADVPFSPCSGAEDIIADAPLLFHGLVPVVTLVLLSYYTRARLFFTFWRFLILI